MLDSGAVACATPDEPRHNSVANIDEVTDQFRGVPLPRIAQLLVLAHDRVATEVRPRLRPTLRHPQDRVGVMQLAKGIHVPRVPRLERGLDDLHVLLRHRLRSISALTPRT